VLLFLNWAWSRTIIKRTCKIDETLCINVATLLPMLSYAYPLPSDISSRVLYYIKSSGERITFSLIFYYLWIKIFYDKDPCRHGFRKPWTRKDGHSPPAGCGCLGMGKPGVLKNRVPIIIHELPIYIVGSSIIFVTIGALSIGDTMAIAETLMTNYFER
jgi:hypothetical protein